MSEKGGILHVNPPPTISRRARKEFRLTCLSLLYESIQVRTSGTMRVAILMKFHWRRKD
jgi:hypothetical protein